MHSRSLLVAAAGVAGVVADGCDPSKTHHQGYNTNGGNGFPLTTSDGVDRTYTIFIPENYDPTTPAPLIFSYHGNGKTSDNEYYLSEFGNSDYNPDHVAVFPQGLGGSWQSANYSDSNDLGFTTDLLAHLQDEYCIDASRVYANGKSNGGGFVGLLACSSQASAFAAFAMCSGAFYSDNGSQTCSPPRSPMPILEFHGSEDHTISYDGGEGHGGILPTIPDWAARWGQRDLCGDAAHDFQYDGRLNITSYECGDAGKAVQQYWIQGMGHTWPSTQTNSDNNGDVTFIDATPIIMDFFNSYTLPQ